MFEKKKINDFLKKVEQIKKEHRLDLSSQEDLAIALMNLISLEEHLFFTANKTGQDSYYDLQFQIRELRKKLLKRIVKDSEGEKWCISKHLLGASMRLIEVGTKYYTQGKKKEAQAVFSQAYGLYSIFFGLNLDLLDKTGAKKTTGEVMKAGDKSDQMTEKMSRLVEELVNCCDE